MVEVSNKQITKVIVYYSDGSFEEVMKSTAWPAAPYPMPYPYTANRCFVCGGDHGVNIPCPKLNPMSNTIPCVGPNDLASGPGCEDPGAQ